jgi:tRNA G18 (ribose-2'-O)-methylase SpoU
VILYVETLDDQRVDAYRHVGDHQWLRARNVFVAESRLLLERLIAARQYQIQSVLVTPAALEAMDVVLQRLDCPVYVATERLLNDIAGFNFHRGCLALAQRPAPRALEDFSTSRLLLGLEGIGNPDNVGGLFRAAAAFAVDGILLDPASGDPFYRKALRTSMGAVLRLPFARMENLRAACQALQTSGFKIMALTTEKSATTLDEFASNVRPDARLLILVGAEGSGLSQDSIHRADARVTIPMAAGVDSLNVIVAAGVALARLAGGRAS